MLSTIDRPPFHLFIELSVQLRVQRDGRDTARRAGPSATIETYVCLLSALGFSFKFGDWQIKN